MLSNPRYLCLWLIGVLLFGYIVGDKGFAYISIQPFYIGEIVLIFALVLFVFVNDYRILIKSKTIIVLILFDIWCLLRTIPFIEEYGMDAARDAVLYGYSIFAFLVAACAFDARVIATVVRWYGMAIYPVITVMPVILVLSIYVLGGGDVADTAGPVPIIMIKTGDLAAHLAGALAFFLVGLSPSIERWSLRDGMFWGAWAGCVLWAVRNRGGFLALMFSILIVVAFGYGRRLAGRLAGVLIVLLIIAALLDLRITMDRRDISVDQLIANITSLVGIDNTSSLEAGDVDWRDLTGTIEWRQRWWEVIMDQTLFGDSFWTGMGFGVNLADVGGFQADRLNHSLRSPHNSTMNILARTGVPGVVLWVLLQGVFVTTLAAGAIRLRGTRYEDWARLNVWLLSYWTALFINGSVDVFLEGPQGGIWYWSVIGFGIAVAAVEYATPKEQLQMRSSVDR